MSASSMRQLVTTDANRDDDTIDVAAFEYNVEDYGVSNLMSEFDDARIWPTGTAKMPFLGRWISLILAIGDILSE